MSNGAFVKTIGKARRSQAVSSFGIGTVIDFPNGSFMPLGLDEQEWIWNSLPAEARESMTIHEPRLQKLLDVPAFLTVPIPSERELGEFGSKVKKYWAVPATRFPAWQECPSCHRLGMIDDPFEVTPELKLRCVKCQVHVNPVRFITACKNGHIDDFPWELWAHSKKGKTCATPKLFLRSRGKSAALGDLSVHCASCEAGRSLHDIFTPNALKMLTCRGKSPWLKSSESCPESPPTVLQRGGSNVHFPVVASMLSIPPASEALAKILEPYVKVVRHISDPATLESVLSGVLAANHPNVSTTAALSWFKRRLDIDTTDNDSDERSSRYQEYEALSSDCPPKYEGNLTPEFESRVSAPPLELQEWFDLIAGVRRLREVRAYCGFTRINPWSMTVERIQDARRRKVVSPLSLKRVDWLPAVEVRGHFLPAQRGADCCLEC